MRTSTTIEHRVLAAVNELVNRICASGETISLMEVCGTHTMVVSSFGIRRAIERRLRLLSGPGCPICVTSPAQIDAMISLARLKGVTILTFGDMMRVPGSTGSLEQARAAGADVRVVYSVLDGMRVAQNEPRRDFVFIGVGFETTAPTVAAAVIQARKFRLANFFVFPIFKLIPPALKAVIKYRQQLQKTRGGIARLDGFLLPGHVSTIIGYEPYRFLAEEFGLPCVIAGFESIDVLQGILMLLTQLLAMKRGHKARVEVQYRRIVGPQGNRHAKTVLTRVFKKTDAEWRGLGKIPRSGLEFRPEFSAFDAGRRYGITATTGTGDTWRGVVGRMAKISAENCRCGEVMLGLITPTACVLFGSTCVPERPVGPCMVSSEGACAAYYRYER